MAQQFCTSHLAIINATFNTNNKSMLLLTAIGVNNKDKTFLIAIAYIPSKSTEAYHFFFKCIREEIFNSILKPAIWLSNMAGDIIKAVDELNYLPSSVLLYYIWHTYQAILTRLSKGHYTSLEKIEM